MLAQGLAVFADHTDLVYELSLCAWETGDLAEAERLARRCLEIGDAPAEYIATAGKGTYLALGLLAEIQRGRGDGGAAEETWRQTLAQYPDYTAPLLPLATAMLARGATADEVTAIVPPDRPSAMLLVGTAFHEAGFAADAETWFRAALERQPANGVARVGLIEALLSQRRYAEAAAEADAEPLDSPLAPVVASSSLFAQAVLADVDGLTAAIARAEAAGVAAHDLAIYGAWRAAIGGATLPAELPAEAAPTLLTALEALLRVQEFESFELGTRLLERAALDPRERRELLARMYLRRGFLESAADEWVAVAQAGPDAQAYVGLAQVAFARGLADDSVAFLEAALELEPQNADAGRMLAGVQQLAA